jgi:hypothetical protein
MADFRDHRDHRSATDRRQARYLVWLSKVEALCRHKVGCDLADLCDAPYSDLFEAGVSPDAALRQALDDM